MRLQQLQQKHLIKLVPLGAVNLQIFSAIMRTASEKLCGESCKQFTIVCLQLQQIIELSCRWLRQSGN